MVYYLQAVNSLPVGPHGRGKTSKAAITLYISHLCHSTNAFVPIMGLFFIATGFFLVFGAALTYLVDTFQKYAASAVAANTFVRSVFAGSLPLVVGPLYHNLGTGIGSTITGMKS